MKLASICLCVFSFILAIAINVSYADNNLQIYKLKTEKGVEFKIPYKLKKTTIENMALNISATSLILSLQSVDDDILEISIPRDLRSPPIAEISAHDCSPLLWN